MIESLYAVIVNWNLKDDTLACVESLVAAGALLKHIIVVDNGSSDGSPQALRERFGTVLSLLEGRENLGFARGNNIGIQYALDHAARWILLLNNDTHVARTFLTELAQVVDQDQHFSILAPLILYHDFPDRIWYLGDRLIPGLLFTHSLCRGQKDNRYLPTLLPVDFITGCAMLVKREVFERVGLFDPALFMYGEDVDFCWRARVAGFHLAVAPRAKMWHKVSTSSNRDRQSSRFLRTRNQNRFYRINSRGVQVPLMLALSGLRAFALALADLVHGRRTLIAPLFRGWIQGWWNTGNNGTGCL
jgi:GT2 family glycosyltransferase